ncbi:Retrotransposon gag protein [Corchorus olitorius]|uniref:Retrotransposon gag protein n=1 Tax=Corchorus olitorius TaxID=93759 RepID=A0A1R3KFY8_9ROSI|nr:Retrotransposon gag protein [Corchorus olitorius]
MPPKVDYGEAIAALTAQIQDLKSTVESNATTINAIQSKVDKLPITPPFSPILVPSISQNSSASGSSALSNYPTKPPRYNLTYFDGTDPQSWIFQAEQYFQIYAIPAQQKLTITSFFMLGEPLTWFQWMFRNHQLTDWPSFARALELRYSPSGHTKPQVALFKLRQTSTVAQYQKNFEILANRVQDEEDDVSGFSKSDESMSFSLASLPLPHEPQMLSDSDPNDFQVSLHALYGQSSLTTLKLEGEISGYKFTVMVDSGSTHNLIQPRLAQFLQLPIEPAPPLTVIVGNGETLRCLGQVTNLPVGLQGHEFSLDLYLLEVRGADIILGMQWLSQLGPMLADFANLSLTFVHQG